jgi:heat shock protein HtpX
MWEQIQANRRRSIVLVTTMAGVLSILGWLGGEAIAPGAGVIGLAVALIIFLLQLTIYFGAAESMLLGGAFAREISRDDSPRLFNIVEEMKIASGLSFMPRIFIVDDPAPNAFAIGNKPERSAIAVTTGLLHRLNRDELQGVIAHEVGHLKNRDVQFMTLAAVMLGSIVLLSEVIWRTMRFGGRGRSRSSSRGGGQAAAIILVVALVFAILGPLMAQLLYFACSRKREYLADASGAQFTRYPEGLASALEKISQARVPLSFASKATAPMFIINPLAAEGGSGSLLATHPPTHERIRILRSMGGASLADYETAYRQAKGAGVIGAASLRAAPAEPIRAPSNEGPIESRGDAQRLSRRAFGYLALHCSSCGLEIDVPERYERDAINCIRCGAVMPIPAVHDAVPQAKPFAVPDDVPLQYTRAGRGWESFRCACGRTLQISPAFTAPQVRCNACGRSITVT